MINNQLRLRDNFLFAFNYKPPKPLKKVRRILLVHSAPLERTEISLSRLMNLYPGVEFVVLKRADVSFSKKYLDRVSFAIYSQKNLPEDFYLTEEGKGLLASGIDLAFFCIKNCVNARHIEVLDEYKNVSGALKQLGCENISYGIDAAYRVYPLRSFLCQTQSCLVKCVTLHLPITLMLQEEIEELFELARSGPSKGAIVNLGNFQGGTAMVLAKGSKLNRREKVYSFDTIRYNWTDDIWKQNQVDDWIVFKQMESEEAAKEWGKHKCTQIRLLLIDTDHSYEGCLKDIVSWSPYLAHDGIIAIHDYCHLDEAGVVRAVHDTILNNQDYQDFRQIESLFLAKKVLQKSD